MKNIFKLSLLSLAIVLSGCDNDDDKTIEEEIIDDPVEEVVQGEIFGPFTTGSSSEPLFAYFDLNTQSLVTLTDEEAATDTQWDIAFKRTGVYLNEVQDTPVSVYFTGNNADFYDENGDAVVDTFVAATPDAELEDYTAVTFADIPADENAFVPDVTERILDGFYNYDATTHVVTAADDKYFIVQSDELFTKYRATSLTQDGFGMSAITLAIALQDNTTEAFGDEVEVEVDLTSCVAGESVYIDLDTQAVVTSTDAFDLTIACSDAAADFAIDLVDDATAIQDFANSYAGIPVATASYYGFKSNEYSELAFAENKWYAYNLQGGHKLWSQYGVYIVKVDTQYFKVQITSYYNEDGESGNYSLRADELTSD